jgi:hypothetical protein
MGDVDKTRSYSYIKPLSGSIGPRQTRCNITERMDIFDLEKAVGVIAETCTPDVPNGNNFKVKTRYTLSWGPSNRTRIKASWTIEWTGSSWIKGSFYIVTMYYHKI